MEFWVGFQRLGLGFKNKRERRRRGEEERENDLENKGNGFNTPFICMLGRVDPRPGPYPLSPDRWIQILMDLDQSNAPGALA